MLRPLLVWLALAWLVPEPAAAQRDVEAIVTGALSGVPPQRTDRNALVRMWSILDIALNQNGHAVVLASAVVPDAATAVDETGAHHSSRIVFVPAPHRDNALLSLIAKRVRQRLGSSVAAPVECDFSDMNAGIQCCTRSPSRECLADWPEDASDYAALSKIQWSATLADLIAIEVAGFTKAVSSDELPNGAVEAGAVYFAWPNEGPAGAILLTRLNAELLERLTATVTPLLPHVNPNADGTAFLCTGGRFALTAAAPGATSTVTRALPNNRRSPHQSLIAALPARGSPGGLVLSFMETDGPIAPFKGKDWDEFLARSLKDGSLASCISSEGTGELTRNPGLTPQMRNPEVSSFFFNLLYLSGLWSALEPAI